jgi:hypothetical protein
MIKGSGKMRWVKTLSANWPKAWPSINFSNSYRQINVDIMKESKLGKI